MSRARLDKTLAWLLGVIDPKIGEYRMLQELGKDIVRMEDAGHAVKRHYIVSNGLGLVAIPYSSKAELVAMNRLMAAWSDLLSPCGTNPDAYSIRRLAGLLQELKKRKKTRR